MRVIKSKILETRLKFYSNLDITKNPIIDFQITFSDEDGNPFDTLSWCVANSSNLRESKVEYAQLCYIGKLIGTDNPNKFVGRNVSLIIDDKSIYGIGNINNGLYVVPEFYYSCNRLRSIKTYYNLSEALVQIDAIKKAEERNKKF